MGEKKVEQKNIKKLVEEKKKKIKQEDTEEEMAITETPAASKSKALAIPKDLIGTWIIQNPTAPVTKGTTVIAMNATDTGLTLRTYLLYDAPATDTGANQMDFGEATVDNTDSPTKSSYICLTSKHLHVLELQKDGTLFIEETKKDGTLIT